MKILLSTLRYVQSIAGTNNSSDKLFSSILTPYDQAETDQLISLSGETKKQVISSLDSILCYPYCSICMKTICGNHRVCTCRQYAVFRKERNFFENEIKIVEQAIQSLKHSAFRPLRNAYGFGAGIFAGINGLVAAIGTGVSIAASLGAIICAAAILPGFISFGYVFKRGADEEEQTINDYAVDSLDHAIRMRHQHIESVKLRQHSDKITNVFLNQSPLLAKQKKEKRGLLGNPFSHFIVTALTTFSVFAVLILKIGALVAGLVSNPMGWAIAAMMAVAVGCYFAHKRYLFLTNKINCDAKSEGLKHHFKTLTQSINELKAKLNLGKLFKLSKPTPILAIKATHHKEIKMHHSLGAFGMYPNLNTGQEEDNSSSFTNRRGKTISC